MDTAGKSNKRRHLEGQEEKDPVVITIDLDNDSEEEENGATHNNIDLQYATKKRRFSKEQETTDDDSVDGWNGRSIVHANMDIEGTSKKRRSSEVIPDPVNADDSKEEIDSVNADNSKEVIDSINAHVSKEVKDPVNAHVSKEVIDRPVNADDNSKETGNERTITLDMSKYSPDIRRLTDSQLVEIFDIGVAIKQSFTLTVSESSDFVKKELESQMEPIVKQMGCFQTDMNQRVSSHMIQFTNEATALKTGVLEKVARMKNDLVGQVEGVCQKVKPMRELEDRVTIAIQSSVRSVLKQLEDYKREVNQVTQHMQKPAIKGSVGENTVMSILRKNIPSFTFTDVSHQPGGGDIHVQSPDDHHFLVEVKAHTRNVPKSEIDKFIQDVANSHEVKVGLMLSLKTGIAKKSRQRNFQVDTHNTKFLIYVPNALDQKEIVVWSVLLANELAGMNVALKKGQAEKLQKLCEKFREKVSGVKKCREKMEILKGAIKDLESNMEPMLEVIENAKKEINDIM